tara:strand:- start:4762 stop:5337 length:576 start_codon:yes stop_codon:yes gene_type:complete
MRFIFKLLILSIHIYTYSQIDYGFKAGINLNTNSDISIFSQDFDTEIKEEDYKGFFIGGYFSIEGLIMSLRPEIQYVKTKNSKDLIQDKIEVPITIGYKILPFLSIFAGPSFQYILKQKSNSFSLEEISDKTTMGLNLGTRLYLGRIQFDLRYERGFNPMETKILNQNNFSVAEINTRNSLFSIGLYYKIN